MTTVQMVKQEQNLFKAGGLAGILGSIIFIVVFVIVGVFVGEDPVELEGWLTRFPDIRTARIFENSLYLLVLILWIPHALALFYALKSKSLAAALFGMSISIGGLLIMAAGALPHIATSQLADIYYAADATSTDQATIVLMWQGTWAVFDALLIAGLAFIPLAFLSFGVAMRQHPNFGNFHGWLSIVLSVLGFGAIGISMVNPNSPSAAIIVFGMIIFHFVIGWKLFNLSKQV
ncbi:MAG: hypothetical protein WBC91_17445 [Phototrophicaceae bacterium]